MSTEAEQQETNDVIIDGEAEEAVDAEPQDELGDPEAEQSEPDAEESEEGNDDEVIVTIGDTPAPEESEEQKAPEWVRELRKSHREVQRKNRELEAELKALKEPAAKQVTLGAKPKLGDYDYDTEQYEQELASWYDKKRQVDQQEAEALAAQESQQKAWQQKLDTYAEKKASLKVKNFDDAESAVLESFDQTQQGIVMQGADDAALTVYALGNNPAKLKELASIKDPVEFSFAVAKLEAQLKVKKRKAPPPERTLKGTAPSSGGAAGSDLERLRDEAAKSGDYSKVHQYKKQLKLKARK